MTRSRKAIFYAITILIVYGILRLMDSAAAGLRDSAPEFPDPEPGETAIHKTSEFIYHININSLRLRSPEIATNRERDRVFFVGDSFVFGTGVEEEESFTRQTEEILRKTQKEQLDILNLGYVLISPETYPGRVERVASTIEPDGIFLFVYSNDIADLDRRSLFYHMRQKVIDSNNWLRIAAFFFPNTVDLIVMNYMRSTLSTGADENVAEADSQPENRPGRFSPHEDNKDYAERKQELLVKARALAYLYGKSTEHTEQWLVEQDEWLNSVARGEVSELIVLSGLIRPEFHSICLDLPPAQADLWKAEQRIILKLRDFARDRNIPFGVVYIPAEVQFDRKKWELTRSLGYTVREEWLTEPVQLELSLQKFLKNEEVPFLSLTETCRNAADQRLVWDFDLHFNENGHDAVTPAITEFTRRVMYPDEATTRAITP